MKNKWLIALAAVGIHICIGSVYAWSVLTKPLMAKLGLTLAQTTWTFSLAILCLGLSAGFLGRFVEKVGPRKSGLISMACFCVGLLGSALAVKTGSLALLYISYGVIGGIGLGIGYITPVSTLVKYFPNNRGFATGLAIMGFGFASLIAGPLMQHLVSNLGLVMNFIILAIIYCIVMTASALYLAPPPEGAVAAAQARAKKPAKATYKNAGDYTTAQAMKTWPFYALWWIFFINITCGIGLLAVASPMAQEVTKMSAASAASMVGLVGLLNGAGRIVWSTISDYIGRKATYLLFFIIESIAFYSLAQTSTAAVFEGLVLLIVSCYGGGFSCMPAYLSDLFGMKELSSIHGRILTAWGLAGIAGPLFLSLIREHFQSYELCLYVFVALFIVNVVVAAVLAYGTRHKQALACLQAQVNE